MKIHIDFETRSEAKITNVGAYEYSIHPSTEILCCAYAAGDNKPEIIYRYDFSSGFYLETNTREFNDLWHLAYSINLDIFTAHNAYFEQCIWQNIMVPRYGFPPLPPERWQCTAAKALSHGLPKSLDGCSSALGLQQRKDDEGKKIMMKMCKPRKPTKTDDSKWHESPEDFEKLYAYCIQDVIVEREIDKMLPDLNPTEQKIWYIDQKINLRGVPVDLHLVDKAISFAEEYSEELNNELCNLTGGDVPRASMRDRMLCWLRDYQGLVLPNLQSTTVEKTLETREDLSWGARRALEIKSLLGKSSVKKYEAFKAATSNDGRFRGAFTYHSASTGRWGSNLVQLQNLPRPEEGLDTDMCAEAIRDLSLEQFQFFYPSVMNALASCVRSAIRTEKELVVADFSKIESVGIAWLANEPLKLEIFRRGDCNYCQAASLIYGYEVNKKDHPSERQVGKISELALGYGGGIGAYGSMAKQSGVDLNPAYDILWPTATPQERQNAKAMYKMYSERVEEPLDPEGGKAANIIKDRWRAAHPNIVQWWSDLENSAIHAVYSKGELIQQGKVFWQMLGEFLYCRLPSGRLLAYHKPELKFTETKWGGEKCTLYHMSLESQSKKYIKVGTYGGKLAENITQAVCRDLMAEAMIRVDAHPTYDIIMTVHDELVTEADIGRGNHKELEKLMEVVPIWADGFPVSAEGWVGGRYKK